MNEPRLPTPTNATRTLSLGAWGKNRGSAADGGSRGDFQKVTAFNGKFHECLLNGLFHCMPAGFGHDRRRWRAEVDSQQLDALEPVGFSVAAISLAMITATGQHFDGVNTRSIGRGQDVAGQE
jgi:hypothetical protein